MIRCDCGYVCVGGDDDELVADARQHARSAHGIDVPAAQVLSTSVPGNVAADEAS